ncbi:MAG: hypothetical protein HC934_11800 [Acaryochloridaceae cyanobacterium SU_2_1]|nr:hypothetical protein [Acaryochloridaceae cyanobacterium SU_2_1]
MDDSREILDNRAFKRLWLFIYLVPVFGIVPVIWTLNRRQSDPQQREVSRVAATIAILWVLGTFTLTSGVAMANTENAQGLGLSLLIASSLWTSGYFLTNLWMMSRVWRRLPIDLPGMNRITKYLP